MKAQTNTGFPETAFSLENYQGEKGKENFSLTEERNLIGTCLLDIQSGRWKGSSGFIKMLGIEPKDSYMLAELEAVIHPDDRKEFMFLLEECKDTLKGFLHDYRYVAPNAKVRYMHSKFIVQTEPKNNRPEIVMINQDVTSYKQTEMEFMEIAKQSELKSKLIAMASHEFRNLLGGMSISVNLLEKYEGPQYAENRAKHLGSIRRNMKSLVEILDEFLSFSKTSSGNIIVAPVKFNIVSLFSDIIGDISTNLTRHTVVYNHTEEVQEVFLDRGLIKVCIGNLINNGIKYSPQGGKVHVYSELNKDINMLYLSVTDNGIGIPERDRENIFNEFYRASNVQDIKGTGLGLNMTKRLLDLMNGEITFVSKQNAGTTFLIKIPLPADNVRHIC